MTPVVIDYHTPAGISFPERTKNKNIHVHHHVHPIIHGPSGHLAPLKLHRFVISFPLNARVLLVLEDTRDKRPEVIHIRLQARLLPVRQRLALVVSLAVAVVPPGINLSEQALHRGHAQGVERLEVARIDGHADAAGARMDDKGTLQQVVEFLANLDIQPRVRVLEDDVLLGFEEGLGVEVLARARLGHGVDVGPFGRGGASRGCVPLAPQRVVEGLVRQELEQLLGAFRCAPGILAFEDIVLEV